MFNEDLVEADWDDVDQWDFRGHYTTTRCKVYSRSVLQNAIYLAFCDGIDYGLVTLNDVGGVLLTHLESIRQGMGARGTLCDLHAIESFEGLFADTSNADGLEVDADARKEMAMDMIDEWITEEFPDEDQDDCGE